MGKRRLKTVVKQKGGEEEMYDVIIIGGGVSGAASARELSRYQASICVLDRKSVV